MNTVCEITNMVMVEDPASGKVLVQNRVLYWKGISFPGGHVEDGESFYESAVREVREETGLEVRNLRLCGIVHWFHSQKRERYMVFLYKTSDYSGELISGTQEGEVFWASKEELLNMPLSPHFDRYLQCFLKDEYSEVFAVWNDTDSGQLRLI